MSIKKCMLAGKVQDKIQANTEKHLKWIEAKLPMYGSRKLDGIRTLTHPELGPVTRTFESVPNDHIRAILGDLPHGLDGEVVTFNKAGVINDFNTIQGDYMRKEGAPNFRFMVFDSFLWPDDPFETRFQDYQLVCKESPYLETVWQCKIETMESFHAYLADSLARGFEGAMYRDPKGLYKEGRSTVKQAWLVKMKEFLDAEGTVMDLIEAQRNDNEKVDNKVGGHKRPTKKENMVGKDTLGALVLSTEFGELKVGTGFTADEAQWMWDHKAEVLGSEVTFTYQPFGMQKLPRFPTFKCIRDKRDIS